MSDYYNELLKEGEVLKQNHKKTKHIFKVFWQLIMAVIFTCGICYFLSELNLIFDFYDSIKGFVLVLLLVVFIAVLLGVVFSDKKREQTMMFTIYIEAVSLMFLRYYDFSNLLYIALQIGIILGIFFVLMLFSSLSDIVYIISTVIVMCVVLVLYLVNIFSCSAIFIMEIIIFCIAAVYYLINKVSQNQNITIEKLNKRLYGHLVFLYTLFVCACSIVL